MDKPGNYSRETIFKVEVDDDLKHSAKAQLLMPLAVIYLMTALKVT